MPERRHNLLRRLAESNSFAQRPRTFADSAEARQECKMDAFSEILSGVKLNGAVLFTAEFASPWGLSVPASNIAAATLGLGAAHLLLYHRVVAGGARIELTDG